jgi:hypothetical protein
LKDKKDLPKFSCSKLVINPSPEGIRPVKAFESENKKIIQANECIFVASANKAE